jgi:hypothetical protein
MTRVNPVSNQSKIHRQKVSARRKFPGRAMPSDMTDAYGDIMRVVENNGHVTLPRVPFFENRLTSRQLRAFGVCLVALGFVALFTVARRTL